MKNHYSEKGYYINVEILIRLIVLYHEKSHITRILYHYRMKWNNICIMKTVT